MIWILVYIISVALSFSAINADVCWFENYLRLEYPLAYQNKDPDNMINSYRGWLPLIIIISVIPIINIFTTMIGTGFYTRGLWLKGPESYYQANRWRFTHYDEA